MLHLPKLRVTGHQIGGMLDGRGESQGVGVGDGVAGLQFGGAEDQVVGAGEGGEIKSI